MKPSRIIVAVSIVATLFAASAALAGWGSGGFGRGLMYAQLDESQQKQAQQLSIEFMKKAEPIRSEMRKKRIQMMELATKDELDRAALEKLIAEKQALRDKLRAERRSMLKEMRALLTPEQLREWVNKKGTSFGKGRRGPRWGGRGCGGFAGPGGQGCPFRRGGFEGKGGRGFPGSGSDAENDS